MHKTQTIALLLSLLCLLCLTGCWDAKEIQHINYITAVGVDFEKGKYIFYAQMLDFTSVARQEGGKPNEPAHVWVSKTSGISLNEAIDKLYRTAQQHVFYSHINAIIFSDAVLNHGADIVFDLANRYREIRYTKWVFGTTTSIEKLLNATPFFNESPLSSVLHQPRETYTQNSYIVPLQFQRFISYYNEKAKTAHLPTLALNSSVWKNNLKKHPLLEVTGSFFMAHRGQMKGFLSLEDLVGLRWLKEQTVRTPVFITRKGSIVATVIMQNPQVTITPRIVGDKLTFGLRVKLKGTVNELGETVKVHALQRMTEQRIRKEIKETYARGIDKQIDLYELGYQLYLRDPAMWKRFFGSKDVFPLMPDSLQPIEIDVMIHSTGKYQFRK